MFKKVPRIFARKLGVQGKTDAAHKLANEVVNEMLSHKPGRPYSEEARKGISKQFAGAYNLRIKSVHGNRVVDREHDQRIMEAMNDGSPLDKKCSKREPRSNTMFC